MAISFEVLLPSLRTVRAEILTQSESTTLIPSLVIVSGPFNEPIERNIRNGRYSIYHSETAYYLKYNRRNSLDQGVLIYVESVDLVIEFIMSIRYLIKKNGIVHTSVLVEGESVEEFAKWFSTSREVIKIKQNPSSLYTSYFSNNEVLKIDNIQPYGVYYSSFASYKLFNPSFVLDKDVSL